MTHLAGEPAFGCRAGGQPCPSVEVAAVVLRLELLLHGAHEPQVLLTSLCAHQGRPGGHLERQEHPEHWPHTLNPLLPGSQSTECHGPQRPCPPGPSRALRLGVVV